MTALDYFVLIGTLLFIVIYGVIKTRKQNKNIKGYLLGDNNLKWGTIGLSIMATQASAITFLSTPGQAYESGMAFIQNYLGLPIALLIVSAVFIPIYYKLNVYTAYEFLEKRFDLKSRMLAAFLFLVQRGLAAGITIYAPAIVLSSMLGWNLTFTIITVGVLVIVYTVSGGTKAVSLTQKWQMGVIMLGMFIAFYLIIVGLPENISFSNAVDIAGKMGKTEAINFNFDIKERYTFWSGITGGLFLALSYFGTDQSQVQRYLGGKSTTESRFGLMFNAILKIPMQFFILFTGVMAFVFFQFEDHDILFDKASMVKIEQTEKANEINALRDQHKINHEEKKAAMFSLSEAIENENEAEIAKNTQLANALYDESRELRSQAKALVVEEFPDATAKDSDYVFLTFIMDFMPAGLVGLLLAVILSAAMSSTAGELNALGSTTSIDFYKRIVAQNRSEKHYVIASKVLTAFWGIMAISFALIADLFENLIEAVNILGSIFYGTILGIFLVAFFIKYVRSAAVFFAAVVAQAGVIIIYWSFTSEIAYLYYNLIGCVLVILFSLIFEVLGIQKLAPKKLLRK